MARGGQLAAPAVVIALLGGRLLRYLPFFMSGLQPCAPHAAEPPIFRAGAAEDAGAISIPASTAPPALAAAAGAAAGATAGVVSDVAVVVAAGFMAPSSTLRADSDLLQPMDAVLADRTASAAKSPSNENDLRIARSYPRRSPPALAVTPSL